MNYSGSTILAGEADTFRRVFAALAGGNDCYGVIQATSEAGFVYFGTPFFQALLVVHDYGEKHLGFATRTFL